MGHYEKTCPTNAKVAGSSSSSAADLPPRQLPFWLPAAFPTNSGFATPRVTAAPLNQAGLWENDNEESGEDSKLDGEDECIANVAVFDGVMGEYNVGMGGIDEVDQNMANTRIRLRTVKWIRSTPWIDRWMAGAGWLALVGWLSLGGGWWAVGLSLGGCLGWLSLGGCRWVAVAGGLSMDACRWVPLVRWLSRGVGAGRASLGGFRWVAVAGWLYCHRVDCCWGSLGSCCCVAVAAWLLLVGCRLVAISEWLLLGDCRWVAVAG